MNDKTCPTCDYPFKDGDTIVAMMVSTYHTIPSDVHYAIEQPTRCIEIVHNECFDWEEYDDRPDIEVQE